jgi:hypothetical protein
MTGSEGDLIECADLVSFLSADLVSFLSADLVSFLSTLQACHHLTAWCSSAKGPLGPGATTQNL